MSRGGSRGAGFRSFRVEGFEVLVGRGDRDNDALTFQVGRPSDFWLHVGGGVSGSHVVVRNPESLKALPRDVAQRAAELAAWYSKARAAGGKITVHVCRVADVRKRPGAPPGEAQLLRFSSLKVYAKGPGPETA